MDKAEPQLEDASSLQFKTGEAGERPGDVIHREGLSPGLRAGRSEKTVSRLSKQLLLPTPVSPLPQ